MRGAGTEWGAGRKGGQEGESQKLKSQREGQKGMRTEMESWVAARAVGGGRKES